MLAASGKCGIRNFRNSRMSELNGNVSANRQRMPRLISIFRLINTILFGLFATIERALAFLPCSATASKAMPPNNKCRKSPLGPGRHGGFFSKKIGCGARVFCDETSKTDVANKSITCVGRTPTKKNVHYPRESTDDNKMKQRKQRRAPSALVSIIHIAESRVQSTHKASGTTATDKC